jgi:hypothetical protein
LLAVLYVESSPLQSSAQPAGVKVVVERVERVSRDEVHFSVRLANESGAPVFLTGIKYERPVPYPVFLEQWREKEGWKTVAPCVDVPPPDVIKMKPGEAITLDHVLKLPPATICKDRNIQLEGRFRFRLDYFRSKKQARTYVKVMFSRDWHRAQAAAAVSEPFEVPPARE